LFFLEGELHPASFIHERNMQKTPETGLEKGLIHRERRRMLPLPHAYAYERKDLIDDRFFTFMLLQAKACLQP